MLVFQTYQQADAYFHQQHSDGWSDFQVWRVRVFEDDLPTPKLVLAPGELAKSGRLYWNHWWNGFELHWLRGRGVN